MNKKKKFRTTRLCKCMYFWLCVWYHPNISYAHPTMLRTYKYKSQYIRFAKKNKQFFRMNGSYKSNTHKLNVVQTFNIFIQKSTKKSTKKFFLFLFFVLFRSSSTQQTNVILTFSWFFFLCIVWSLWVCICCTWTVLLYPWNIN